MKKLTLRSVPNREPTPPAGLSEATASWWRTMQHEYGIADAGGLTLLSLAAEARDRMVQASALILEHGEVLFPAGKANPACAIERDARTAMVSALRGLHLEVEPVRPTVGRPLR